MARGVWSGVGLSESWEKEGEEGAVDCGDIMEGREGECERERAGEFVAVEVLECWLEKA